MAAFLSHVVKCVLCEPEREFPIGGDKSGPSRKGVSWAEEDEVSGRADPNDDHAANAEFDRPVRLSVRPGRRGSRSRSPVGGLQGSSGLALQHPLQLSECRLAIRLYAGSSESSRLLVLLVTLTACGCLGRTRVADILSMVPSTIAGPARGIRQRQLPATPPPTLHSSASSSSNQRHLTPGPRMAASFFLRSRMKRATSSERARTVTTISTVIRGEASGKTWWTTWRSGSISEATGVRQ